MRHHRLILLLWTAAIAAVFLYGGVQLATPRLPVFDNTNAAQLDALIHQIARDTVYAQTNDCGGLALLGMERLQAAGYAARRINIATLETPNGYNDGHLLNEVFNPQSASWEVVDFSSDRWYRQTAWAFVQERVDFTPLTTDRITAIRFVDEFGAFAEPEKFYDRVGQAVAIEADGIFWYGDSANQEELNAYGYVYDPQFMTRFYA